MLWIWIYFFYDRLRDIVQKPCNSANSSHENHSQFTCACHIFSLEVRVNFSYKPARFFRPALALLKHLRACKQFYIINERTSTSGAEVMKDLSIKAKIFILASILIGIGLSAWQLSSLTWGDPWLWGLALAAAAGQVFKVHGSTERSNYNISWIVYAFTFFHLGVSEALFVILFAHLVEWIWHKYPWYIQAFNISTYALAISIIGQISVWIMPTGLEPTDQLWAVAAILVMMAAFTVINHFLVGMVIKLARGQGFSQSGVFGLLTLMIDFSMLGLGTAAALVANTNIFGIVITILPLYLIYSTLKVPALQRQTEIDPKTKLYNARYFADELEKELARAERFDRPMTLVMADLDLLRNINNTYGHLAGDVVLIGVAEILQKFARDYDVVARFGGEEFSILLPETTVEDAFPMVEVMRQAVEAAEFEVSTSVTPIKVTMSFGITGRDTFGQSMTDIIHNADMALYHSKLSGRNLTTVYALDGISDLFDSASLEAPKPDEAALQSRIEISQQRFRPNPVREVQGKELSAPPVNATQSNTNPENVPDHPTPQPAPEPPPSPSDKKPAKKTKPWVINAYIFGLSLIAIVLFALILPHHRDHWLVRDHRICYHHGPDRGFIHRDLCSRQLHLYFGCPGIGRNAVIRTVRRVIPQHRPGRHSNDQEPQSGAKADLQQQQSSHLLFAGFWACHSRWG